MSLEHTTRAITENKYSMQLFADRESLKADIIAMENLKASNPNDDRVSDYAISQKKYELSQIEKRIKGKDYSSVKSQCEQYFADNSTLFDKNQIIAEAQSMVKRGQTVNEWPHLAAVFLLDHAVVTGNTQQQLQGVVPPAKPQKVDPVPPGSLSSGEDIVTPEKKPTKPGAALSAKPQTAATPTVQPKPENIPEILTVQQKIIFKDGVYYLTGPKGNTRRVEVSELLVNLNLPKNAPENLKKSAKMIGDFSLLLDAYIAANPKETAKYESAVRQIQGLFAQEDIQMGKKVLDVTSITSGMFDNFWRTFSDTELKKVNDVFRMQDESARRFALLNFIRDDLEQSDIVLGNIIKNNPGEFSFPSDENILKNGDISAAGLLVSGRQKVADTIRKARQEAASNWTKNYKEYIAMFKAQNPGVQFDEETARKNNEELTILALAKREIMYQQLYNKDLKLKPELALAQDIMGAADFDMSDKSWDVSKEIGGMIAMEAIAIAAGVVTAGFATAAINAAMLGRNAYRGAKALEAYNAATKTRKVLTTSARILGSGAGFEAGAATTRSYIENGDFTSMHSWEGYAQSVAMMGVMSGINKLVTSGRLGKGIQFKEGAGFAKNILPFTGQVAIEGTAIFGTSAAIGSVFFDRRDNWTLEQMAQAMLMAALFKGAGRISASKNSKGEIEVKQVEVKAKEGSVYPERYIVNGKEYRWSSKQEAFLGKNGEKYTKEQFETLQKENAPKIDSKQVKTEATSGVLKQIIESNQLLTDSERLVNASRRLNRQFTQGEKDALLEAHYTDTILQKGRILARKGGFSKEETRILMEEGYAGRRQGLAPGVGPSSTREHLNHQPSSRNTSPADVHAVSDEASKTINQTLASFTDNKAVKIAWDLASKEVQSGGLIKSTLVFPANIMRLPLINARKVMEVWFTKNEKGFAFKGGEALDKIGDSLKIAATASSKPFEGKTQSMLTLATMGTVLWMTYDEISQKNPSSPKDWTWGMAVTYLKNMNITFPVEFTKWFFDNRGTISDWFNGK